MPLLDFTIEQNKLNATVQLKCKYAFEWVGQKNGFVIYVKDTALPFKLH